ncbi:MAG: glycosyltransferase [Acidimicrobiales bacterium]
METRAPAVVAVVVATDPCPYLEVTLASLVGQDYGELSILVVAHGDAEGVAPRVAAVAPAAFVRVLAENRGFAAACNDGVLAVEGATFYLFCHDDVRLDPDAVRQLVEAAFRTNAGVVTPKVVAYDDPVTLLHVGQTSDRYGVVRERVQPGEIDDGQQDLERDVFVAPGGVTLVRADLFVALQGFDPLIPALGEDLDFCWRAQLAGARIVVAPAARVAHRESLAAGERAVSAVGTRRASRQDLQRRHRLLVAATGWGLFETVVTLATQLVFDVAELVIAALGRDGDRVGAIVGSWRWILRNGRRVRERRRRRPSYVVLSDRDLRRLQVAGANRVRRFLSTLVRDGFDRARGILPLEEPPEAGGEDDGVGFAAAFAEEEAFDEYVESHVAGARGPATWLTGYRAQMALVVVLVLAWLIGVRNLVAMHLPLVGRLAPLDSWWTTWRHFFASWSPAGVGTGTPGMPGYGVLAIAGTFVLGRMGILPRLALVAAVPLAAYGTSRLVRGVVSNRARLVAGFVALVSPIGLTMIGQGRIDVLTAVAGLPFLVRRVLEVLDVPGVRTAPYGEAVAFGYPGWRQTRAGQRTILVMLTAIVGALAPATIVAVVVVFVGVAVARWLAPDDGRARPWRQLGAVLGSVAVFLLPLTVDTVLAGRRALGVFGAARGPWAVPSFADLARATDGGFGQGWWGWLLPAAALLGLVVTRGPRRVVASRLATVGALALVLATLTSRHWLGSFTPNLDVIEALYALVLAALAALGVAALEEDLRTVGFGWRQWSAGALVVAILALALPFVGALGGGRFDLPPTGVAESMNALAPVGAGGFRVLWLGDPSILPLAGWTVEPGLAAATSTNGLPGGATLFTPPDSGTSDVILQAVSLAVHQRTVRLGALLATAGISTIVVMDAAAPGAPGQRAVVRPVPAALTAALLRQTDLALTLRTRVAAIYTNQDFHGLVSVADPRSPSGYRPLTGSTFGVGTVPAGSTVVAGLAPAGAFALEANGRSATRSTIDGWAPRYTINRYGRPVTTQLVLRQFPLNGVLALFTLALWAVVWLGFGWASRLEQLVGRRRPGHRAGRGTRD